MPDTIDGTGYHKESYTDVLDNLSNEMKSIFGQNIDVSYDSVDGQTLAIFAAARDAFSEILQYIYNARSPQGAVGNQLSRLAALNGVKRKQATFSTVALSFDGTMGTIIPQGTAIQSTVDQSIIFTTDTETALTAFSTLIPSTSTQIGDIQAAPDTLTKIVNPIYGLNTVTNPNAATVGEPEETDAQLRSRRLASVTLPSQGLIDGIYADLVQANGVQQARIYQNVTDGTVNNIPAHSIFAIVYGGDSTEIAESIYKHDTGFGMTGGVSVTLQDSQGDDKVIQFSRPTLLPVFITVQIEKLDGFPGDGEQQIKDNLVALGLTYRIGDNVIQSRMYDAVNMVPNISIKNIFIGYGLNPTSTNDLDITPSELAQIEGSDITITTV